MIPVDIFEDLMNRFKRVVVFFDNDDAGIKSAKVYQDMYSIDSVVIPDSDVKDPADYYKKWGDNPTKQLLKELL
jgi:DNA primase